MAVVAAGDSHVRDADWTDADHFIAFVRHGGRVWEMDGNTPRRGPLDRGPASADLLEVSEDSATATGAIGSIGSDQERDCRKTIPMTVLMLTSCQDAARIIRDVYIPRAEGSVHFATMALVGGAGPSSEAA